MVLPRLPIHLRFAPVAATPPEDVILIAHFFCCTWYFMPGQAPGSSRICINTEEVPDFVCGVVFQGFEALDGVEVVVL